MDYQIIVAIITAGAAIIVAVVSFFLNESAKRKTEWQQKKFGHYQNLLLAISDLVIDGKNKTKANQDFSTASNTIALIAPQKVIDALMAFHDEVKWANRDSASPERHDELLKNLILLIREDIGLSKNDDSKTFAFHLIGSRPNNQ